MTKKQKIVADFSPEEFGDFIDRHMSASLSRLQKMPVDADFGPLAGPTPWFPPVTGPTLPWPLVWPPVCPWPFRWSPLETMQIGQPAAIPPTLRSHHMFARHAANQYASAVGTLISTILTQDQIDKELLSSLKNWKPRFSKVTLKTKLKDLADSGNGHVDVISAVDRSPLFLKLGLSLFPHHVASDETLKDVAETLGTLIKDLGHVVQS